MFKKLITTILIYSFCLLMLACPQSEKSFRKAKELSAEMKIHGIKLIGANIAAFESGEITQTDLASLNKITDKYVDAIKFYDAAIVQAEKLVKSGETLPKDALGKLAALFDEKVVGAFFEIMETFRLMPSANSEKVKIILASIRLTILTIQGAFSQINHGGQTQWN